MIFFGKKNKKVELAQKPQCSQPLTLPELDEQIKSRINIINQEFQDGFDFIKIHPKSVSFFGSARTTSDSEDYQNAYKLASEIAKLNYAVVTGGGPGIMEAANKGAFENQGQSLGLTIKLPMEQITNKYLTENLNFNYFFARKVALTYAAESYVYFPGGYGTLDEFFEILTLVQTNKIEPVPIILFGSYFWNPLIKFIKDFQLAHEKIDGEDFHLFTITDSIEEALEIIKKAPIRKAD